MRGWDGSRYVERPDRPDYGRYVTRKYMRPEASYQPGRASREASQRYATILYVVIMLLGVAALLAIVW